MWSCEFKKRGLAVLLSMILLTLTSVWCQDTIDMSESLLKIQYPPIFYDLGEKGVAAYDVGDKMMKFFDWDFKLVSRFPIAKGEGPGEVKSFIVSTCIVDGKIYILVSFDNNIKVFDQQGKFEKEIILEAAPRDMFFKNGSLYLPNLRINPAEDSFLLGTIVDPFSGKKTKDILLKERLIPPKKVDGGPIVIGMTSTFDVGNDGSIYFLNSSVNLLAAIDGSNRVKYKIDLPYKERTLRQVVKANGEDVLYLSTFDWYTDMRAFDDAVYVCFQKAVKTGNKSDERTCQTIVIKVSNKDEFSEKVFAGSCFIIGRHKRYLHLFNSEEYKVIPVKLSEW